MTYNYDDQIAHHREFYQSGNTRDIQFRLQMLRRLKKAIITHEKMIATALAKDLGKSLHEAITTETGLVVSEINYLIKHTAKLVGRKSIATNIINLPSKSYTLREPYGVTLIMAPWNYPFQLAMSPLAGAIAGGNCAVVKPSELTPNTAKVIEKLITKYFDSGYISVVQGAVPETTALLEQRFDKIFFTGSPKVGSIVMEKAAKHLTPVVLELGGKSPAVIDETAKLDMAVKRLIFGKATNAGQTCVAPDYLLVHESIKDAVVHHFEQVAGNFFHHDTAKSPHFGKIVNEGHFDRLVRYLEDGTVLYGGHHDRQTKHIDLTLLAVDDLDTPAMTEEIFGPILPLVTYKNLDEAMAIIARNPDPLAMYIFSNNRHTIDTLLTQVPFGGGCVNESLVHLSNENLPFGGRGTSGMGHYHGKYSIDAFTHEKAVLEGRTWFDQKVKYPPYDEKNLPIIRRLLYGRHSKRNDSDTQTARS